MSDGERRSSEWVNDRVGQAIPPAVRAVADALSVALRREIEIARETGEVRLATGFSARVAPDGVVYVAFVGAFAQPDSPAPLLSLQLTKAAGEACKVLLDGARA